MIQFGCRTARISSISSEEGQPPVYPAGELSRPLPLWHKNSCSQNSRGYSLDCATFLLPHSICWLLTHRSMLPLLSKTKKKDILQKKGLFSRFFVLEAYGTIIMNYSQTAYIPQNGGDTFSNKSKSWGFPPEKIYVRRWFI